MRIVKDYTYENVLGIMKKYGIREAVFTEGQRLGRDAEGLFIMNNGTGSHEDAKNYFVKFQMLHGSLYENLLPFKSNEDVKEEVFTNEN